MSACTVLSLDWPGAQNGDGLVGRLACACGVTDLFRLYSGRRPFVVEEAGTLHLDKHAAPTWLVCHFLLTHAADPVKEVADMQVMPPDYVRAYATSQGWTG